MALYLSPYVLEHTAETCHPVAFFKKIFGGKEKPATKTIRLDDLDEWVKNKTEALDKRSVPLGKEVLAEIPGMRQKIKELSEELLQRHVPEDVLSSFRAPAENARRHFARGIAAIMGDIELKEPTSHLDVVSLQSTINDALSSVHSLRARQGRYVSEFFPSVYREILRQVSRLSLLAKQLERALPNQNEQFSLLQRISDEKNQICGKLRLLAESRNTEAATESEIKRMNKSMAELRGRMNDLKRDKGYLSVSNQREQIAQYRENIRQLEKKIYRPLTLLARTFRKYVKHMEKSGYQLNVNSRKVLEGYLTQPMETFLNEDDGYPGLKALLSEIRKEVSAGELQLRERSREKTLTNIDKILSGGLMSLKREHRELKQRLKRIEDDLSSSAILKNLKTARENLSNTEHLIKKLKDEKERVSQTIQLLREEITRLHLSLEEQLSEMNGARINLKIEEMENTEEGSQERLRNGNINKSKTTLR